MALIHPGLFHGEDAYVEVDLDGVYTRGCTAADFRDRGRLADKNTHVILDLDREAFIRQLQGRGCASLLKEGIILTKRPVVIDCDPGVDDTLAIVLPPVAPNWISAQSIRLPAMSGMRAPPRMR